MLGQSSSYSGQSSSYSGQSSSYSGQSSSFRIKRHHIRVDRHHFSVNCHNFRVNRPRSSIVCSTSCTYFPVCSSSCTEAARGSPSNTRAIIVINTILDNLEHVKPVILAFFRVYKYKIKTTFVLFHMRTGNKYMEIATVLLIKYRYS